MKLKKMKIEKLHNLYNYEIDFFENVNILFGKNGCGKTTILNIINYIISGKIYKLKQYSFQKIELEFFYKKLEKIIIYNEGENLILKYNEREKEIIRVENFEDRHYVDPNREKLFYLKQYPILDEIKNIFKIVYLPLSREFDDDENLEKRIFVSRYERDEISYLDKALEKTQNLVKEEFARLNVKVEEYEKKLKTEIFEVMFNDKEIEDGEFSMQAENDILDYLKKFNFYTSNVEIQIRAFFKKFKKLTMKYKNLEQKYKALDESNDSSKFEEVLEVLSKMIDARSELIVCSVINTQVERLKDKFEEYNNKIDSVMLPIRQFENIVNSFLKYSSIPKELFVSYDKIYLKMENQDKTIEITDLSSGEKQIITFIAHFIFKVLPAEQPIFIVDEPEMSLHLIWQKNWISCIEELDKNIQLIIATHSPEIVSNYRNNMIKIEPQIEG